MLSLHPPSHHRSLLETAQEASKAAPMALKASGPKDASSISWRAFAPAALPTLVMVSRAQIYAANLAIVT
jgi:hypothetical protein